MLRASYGRFSQGVLTGEFGRFHPGATPITTPASIAATGGYTRIVVSRRSASQPAARSAACARRAPTSTRSASIARSAGAGRRDRLRPQDGRGLHRLDRRRRPVPRRDADVGRRPHVPVFVLVNAPTDRRFLLTNPDGYSLTYNGLVVAVEKRRSHGWQAFGSYTFSRAPGCSRRADALPRGAQVSTVAPPPSRARSGAIPTISPTRAAGCRTIGRTCSASWAASTCRGPAWWSPPTCSTSAASRGRRRRRSRCRKETSASCSSRAARAGCRRRSLLDLRLSQAVRLRALRTHRAAARRAQRAERHGGRRPGDRRICSARISRSRRRSWIRAGRCSA